MTTPSLDGIVKDLFLSYGLKQVYQTVMAEIEQIRKDLETINTKTEVVKQETPKQFLLDRVIDPPTKVQDEQVDKKKKHKDAIIAKRNELVQKGIEPSTLLTMNAMKAWLEAGRTYWWIAEETGNPDVEVSAKAKQYGIKSKVSKMVQFRS